MHRRVDGTEPPSNFGISSSGTTAHAELTSCLQLNALGFALASFRGRSADSERRRGRPGESGALHLTTRYRPQFCMSLSHGGTSGETKRCGPFPIHSSSAGHNRQHALRSVETSNLRSSPPERPGRVGAAAANLRSRCIGNFTGPRVALGSHARGNTHLSTSLTR